MAHFRQVVGQAGAALATLALGSAAHAQGFCAAPAIGDTGDGLNTVADVMLFDGYIYQTGTLPASLDRITALAGLADGRTVGAMADGTGDSRVVLFASLEYPGGTFEVSANSVGFRIDGLAEHDGVVYGVGHDAAASNSVLVEIDVTTGIGSEVGRTAGGVHLVSLAFGEGRLLATSSPSASFPEPSLWEIDPATGNASLGETLTDEVRGLEYWALSGLFVGVGDMQTLIDPAGGHETTPFIYEDGQSPILFEALGPVYCVIPTRTLAWSELKSTFASPTR